MDMKRFGFWASTGLFALAMGAGGAADLSGSLDEAMVQLGMPLYLATILGTWKLLGVVALLAPGFARIKEWAYAGFFFNLSGAAASHILAGHGLGAAVPPLVLLAVGAASYALRDESRAVFPVGELAAA
ncbi:MAG: DoxX family protein [Proteobacteria bacterium]|nr:DoxX family protein [Pseudomonadota bacterium]